jgi:hypothetical protein
MSISD